MHDKAPAFQKDAFNCPSCNAFAAMEWKQLYHYEYNGETTGASVHLALCASCKQSSIWKGPNVETIRAMNRLSKAPMPDMTGQGLQLYPQQSTAPIPSPDLPEECQADYLEARDIVARSPRGAAALWRLVVQ